MIIATWSKKDQKIITHHLGTKKIADFEEGKDFQELNKDLMVVQRFIGVSEIVPAASKSAKMITDYLADHYSDFSSEEITYAFQLAAAEELDHLPDNKHYQSWDAIYLGKILSAYRKMRGKISLKYHTDEDALFRPVPENNIIVHPGEAIKKLCFMAWEAYKKSEPILVPQSSAYDYLHKMGVINYTPEILTELSTSAVVNLRTSGARGTVQEIKNIISGAGSELTPLGVKIQLEMKKLALNKFFYDLRKMDGELSDFFPEDNPETKE